MLQALRQAGSVSLSRAEVHQAERTLSFQNLTQACAEGFLVRVNSLWVFTWKSGELVNNGYRDG